MSADPDACYCGGRGDGHVTGCPAAGLGPSLRGLLDRLRRHVEGLPDADRVTLTAGEARLLLTREGGAP